MSAHCFCRGDYSPAFEQSWVACCRCGTVTYDTQGKAVRGPAEWIPGGRYGLPALAEEQPRDKPMPPCPNPVASVSLPETTERED